MGPQPFSCGAQLHFSEQFSAGHTSMGPQLFYCGDRPLGRPVPWPWPCFNEAAAFQLRRSFCMRCAPPCISTGFNGAAAFQLRRSRAAADGTAKISRFNGAAAFSAAEMGKRPSMSKAADHASTGPQSLNCGDGDYHARAACVCAASMRPQPLSRGDDPLRNRHTTHICVLQWGRSLSAAEIDECVLLVLKLQLASMGPQRFSCGDQDPCETCAPRFAGLQWGRSVSATEIGRCVITAKRTNTCFNGAAAFQPRRFKSRAKSGVRFDTSMGPQPFSCGDA